MFRKYTLVKLFSLFILIVILLTTILNPSVVFSQSSDNATELKKMVEMEKRLEQEYEQHFSKDLLSQLEKTEEFAKTLTNLNNQTGTKSAVIWVMPKENFLHLVLTTSKGQIAVKDIPDANRQHLVETAEAFYLEIDKNNSPMDLTQAQQLYKWIIEPLESEYLIPEKIDTLLFCLGNGIRGLPLAALHDGEKFLIEKYAFSNIPGFSLINFNYSSLQDPEILAMGASEFSEQNSLPAVPIELSTIINELQTARISGKSWQGQLLLNENFTVENMDKKLNDQSFDIIHLATHADFNSGDTSNSYLQFWDRKLTLNQMDRFKWKKPPELLVLSACKTAVGDDQAQLGFTGLALQSGVKSVLGSLWYVSDAGTLALISEFYGQLVHKFDNFLIPPTTKAEALRQAQIMLLKGKVYFKGNRLLLSDKEVVLPQNIDFSQDNNLSHPFYWAGFTLISSPW